MLDIGGCLPKNLNGIRTTHTCELCGFEPKTKNKYREKQDHLVMKHFKDKIDKIFPHCRPYSCPSDDCEFTGKDKQALLRHYTGKHGILERYLREALAENGIHYLPGDVGGKRRCTSVNMTNASAPKIVRTSTVAASSRSVDPKELLPTAPLPLAPRSNTEELRKEVEALMASFQPQSTVENSNVVRIPQGISVTLPPRNPHRIELPQHPEPLESLQHCISSSSTNSASASSQHQQQQQQHHQQQQINLQQLNTNSDLILPTNSSVGPLPSLMVTSLPQESMLSPEDHSMLEDTLTPPPSVTPSLPNIPLPLELISSATDSSELPASIIVSAYPSSQHHLSTSLLMPNLIENKEVMWGAGPAVIVEAADTIPITYIETGDGSYTAMLDAIDYDLLVPSITSSSVDPILERQLDFCTY